MNEEMWAQVLGNFLAVLVVLQAVLAMILKKRRKDSPELRIIREQMAAQNKHMASLIESLKDQNAALRARSVTND